MHNFMRWAALAAVFIFWHTAVWGELKTQPGDRWPQTAARAVVFGDGHVYLGRGNVLTVLAPDLTFVAGTALSGEVQGISYSGGRVYAAVGIDGLQVVDVTTPAAPQALPIVYNPDDLVTGVFIDGGYAYALGPYRVAVIDANDPQPVPIANQPLSGLFLYSTNLFVSNGIAAVADQVNGLHLVDVSDPLNPAWLSVAAIAGAWDVALSGRYAYVTSGAGGLSIFDVGNPEAPASLGSYAPPGSKYMGIAVAGDDAYVADENNGLRRLEISDPTNPVAQQLYPDTRGAYSVVSDGDNVWVGDFTGGLQRVGGGAYDTPADARDVFVSPDYYLYIVDGSAGSDAAREGLRILDAFNAGQFVFKGFKATPGQANAVFAAGDYAYVADGEAGLQIIDASGRADRFVPQIVGSLDTGGSALDVFVCGDFAYVAAGASGLRIVDISDPADPVQSGALPDAAHAVAVQGDYAYVAGPSVLQIIDVSNPVDPRQAGFMDLPGTPGDVAVSGAYAFVAAGAEGLQIVHVATPASPAMAGALDTGGNATGVCISGNYAHVADGDAGLVTIDISDPSAPLRVDEWSVPTNGTALKVCSAGGYAYVAEDKAGAAVYHLTDKEPFIPGPYNPPDSSGCFIGVIESTESLFQPER